MRYGGSRWMGRPPRWIVPSRGGVKPTMERMSVVLPTPLRPRMLTASPAPSVSETPCRTWLSP